MNKYFISIYQSLELDLDCLHLLNELEAMKLNSKEMKSFISLKLRYYIKNNINFDQILSNNTLMKRDYWLCIEYYKDNYEKAFNIMIQNIHHIDQYDIDIMIKNKWSKLIKHWDGYPVVSSFNKNTDNLIELSKYNFNIDNIKTIYHKKIPKKYHEYFHSKMTDCDILIDGANISHIKKEFNYDELIIVIKKLEAIGYHPKIILHERHKINNIYLEQYIIKTPKNYYDDNFLLYGLFQYNKMIVSNDLFRDHVTMNCFEKCHIDHMTIKYIDNTLIIPQYSKCIQVKENNIYIPCIDGIYLLLTNHLSIN